MSNVTVSSLWCFSERSRELLKAVVNKVATIKTNEVGNEYHERVRAWSLVAWIINVSLTLPSLFSPYFVRMATVTSSSGPNLLPSRLHLLPTSLPLCWMTSFPRFSLPMRPYLQQVMQMKLSKMTVECVPWKTLRWPPVMVSHVTGLCAEKMVGLAD